MVEWDKPLHAALEFLSDKWGDFTSVKISRKFGIQDPTLIGGY